MIEKARSLDADMIFLDLEDSVAPSEKAAARGRVISALSNGGFAANVVAVRVNAWDSSFTVHDVVALVEGCGAHIDSLMLPKAQSATEVHALAMMLAQLEESAGLAIGSIGIEVQIESARGLIDVERIAAAPRVEALHFGPGDFAASIEMPATSGGVADESYPGDHFHYVFARMAVAARAAGVQVLDGPYFRVRDQQGLCQYAQRPRALGFDGKWAIHPDQIAVINELFSPDLAQFERAHALLDAYRAAITEGRGAVRFEGEMIDEASRKMALKVVARGERAGFTRG